jgi:phage baseplate assembly protein W
MSKNEKDFLGRGWAFPPSFIRGPDTVSMVSREEDIEQSLEILLSTTLGERFLQPSYGCNLHDYLFESLDASMQRFLEDLIETAILFHEPRIKLDKINMVPEPTKGRILFELHYWVKTTNSRTNYVYPFYKKEGTDLRL